MYAEKTLVMRKVRGEWPDQFKLTARLQQLKLPLFPIVVNKKASQKVTL